jgi:hypothetical protein
MQLDGDLHDHLSSWPILEFNGYIPVVHEPTYIDMGNYIHFNPAPIFIPSPGVMTILVAALAIFGIRRSRGTSLA